MVALTTVLGRDSYLSHSPIWETDLLWEVMHARDEKRQDGHDSSLISAEQRQKLQPTAIQAAKCNRIVSDPTANPALQRPGTRRRKYFPSVKFSKQIS